MRLYALKTCDTCKKALKALAEAGREVDLRDVRADGICDADLAQMFEQLGDKILNTRSTTWRGLSEEQRDATPVELIKAHPTLLKRPAILSGGAWSVGWNKDVQERLSL